MSDINKRRKAAFVNKTTLNAAERLEVYDSRPSNLEKAMKERLEKKKVKTGVNYDKNSERFTRMQEQASLETGFQRNTNKKGEETHSIRLNLKGRPAGVVVGAKYISELIVLIDEQSTALQGLADDIMSEQPAETTEEISDKKETA